MKVFYDDEVDALYIQFEQTKPVAVTELSDGINLDVTEENKVIGIEILDASRRISLDTILSYSLNVEKTVSV